MTHHSDKLQSVRDLGLPFPIGQFLVFVSSACHERPIISGLLHRCGLRRRQHTSLMISISINLSSTIVFNVVMMWCDCIRLIVLASFPYSCMLCTLCCRLYVIFARCSTVLPTDISGVESAFDRGQVVNGEQ